MANTYDAQMEQAEGPADTPDEEQSEQGQGKQPQQAVNYRMGNPQRSCGLCGNFTGSSGDNAFQCATVDGDISAYGYCDIYQRQDNPFLAGTQEGFDAGAEGEAASETPAPTDQPDAPAQGGLQIGNRRYA
jgi:hypothetical protein